jgi:hypothetical protein
MEIDLVSAMQAGTIASYFFQVKIRRHSRVVVDISGCAQNPVIKDERKTFDTVDFKWFF